MVADSAPEWPASLGGGGGADLVGVAGLSGAAASAHLLESCPARVRSGLEAVSSTAPRTVASKPLPLTMSSSTGSPRIACGCHTPRNLTENGEVHEPLPSPGEDPVFQEEPIFDEGRHFDKVVIARTT